MTLYPIDNDNAGFPEWVISSIPVPYGEAVFFMQKRVREIEHGDNGECIWLLEHPSLYTAGFATAPEDYSPSLPHPLHFTERGGRITYHGPGQRVIYMMLKLERQDIRTFIKAIETWILRVLSDFGIAGTLDPDRIGIWVGDKKIAAIGLKVRRWISFHGIALNVAPDLRCFDSIVPCGLKEYGVTSMKELGVTPTFDQVDESFYRHMAEFLEMVRCQK